MIQIIKLKDIAEKDFNDYKEKLQTKKDKLF